MFSKTAVESTVCRSSPHRHATWNGFVMWLSVNLCLKDHKPICVSMESNCAVEWTGLVLPITSQWSSNVCVVGVSGMMTTSVAPRFEYRCCTTARVLRDVC